MIEENNPDINISDDIEEKNMNINNLIQLLEVESKLLDKVKHKEIVLKEQTEKLIKIKSQLVN